MLDAEDRQMLLRGAVLFALGSVTVLASATVLGAAARIVIVLAGG